MNPRLAGRPPGLGGMLSRFVVGAVGLMLALVVGLALVIAAVALVLVWLVRAGFSRLTGRPVGPWTVLAGALWTRWRKARSFGRGGPGARAGAARTPHGSGAWSASHDAGPASPFATRPGRLSDQVIDVQARSAGDQAASPPAAAPARRAATTPPD